MALGELVVSLFPDKIVLELFNKKGKKNYLVKKHFENYHVSFSDFSKIDVLEIEKVINGFTSKTSIKGGKFYINVFAEDDLSDFKEIDLDTPNKRSIKKMLPFEIESLGEKYDLMDYRYEIIGSKVKLYFLHRNIVENLSNINIGNSWDLISVTPGFLIYQGLVQGDGLLVDIDSGGYTVYGFKSGYIHSKEYFNTYGSFDNSKELNKTPKMLFDNIKEELIQYLRNYNFKELTDIDYVYTVFNGDYSEGFVKEILDDVVFESPRDLREWLSVNSDPNEFDVVKSFKVNCKNFDFSSVSLGTFYIRKEINSISFSKERLSFMWKNLLLASLSFSIFLSVGLPSVSIFADNRLDDIKENVITLATSVDKYEGIIEDFESDIEDKDNLIDDYNSYVSSLGGLTDSNRNFISSVLGYLPNNTPTSIVVNSISLEKGKQTLLLEGISQNYKDIGAFAIELEEFGEVSINDIGDNKLLNNSGYPFEIVLKSK